MRGRGTSIRVVLLHGLALLLADSVFAQTRVDRAARILAVASQAQDLEFPSEPSRVSLTNPQMGLYKPDGVGPFPALVLTPHCNGLGKSTGYPNYAMAHWTKEAVDRGYVVLLIDPQGARGVDSTCYEPKGAVYHLRGALDVLQAAQYLRTLPYVDNKRIAQVGFSWGAMAGLLAASNTYRSALKMAKGFAAFVAVYPGCFKFITPQGLSYDIVESDIDRPGLVLMGSGDVETPARQCVSRLKMAGWSGRAPVWHVFAGATHCWDCAHLDGYSKIDFRGKRVTYRFDGAVTAETKKRIFAFLDKVWAWRN